jgi:hypothetical protein
MTRTRRAVYSYVEEPVTTVISKPEYTTITTTKDVYEKVPIFE